MTCSQNDFTVLTDTVTAPTYYPVEAYGSGSRRLLVSDNPELISSISYAGDVLWHDYVNAADEHQLHRAFLWHGNETEGAIKVGVILQNLSSTNTLDFSSCRKQVSSTQTILNSHLAGLCAAKACLGSTMDDFTPIDTSIGPGSTGLIYESSAYNPGYLFGGILDFRVNIASGYGNLNYKIRVVASKNTGSNLRTITGDPVATNGPHPRGSWPFSIIYVTMPTYTFGTNALYKLCDGGTAVDNLFTASASYDSTHAVGNEAGYGCVYDITIPGQNNGPDYQFCDVCLNPRGGLYVGAFRWGSNSSKGIPACGRDTVSDMVKAVACGIPEGYVDDMCSFRVMHAGGANTPLGIYLYPTT